MDKQSAIVITVLGIALGALFHEYRNLSHDFKLLVKVRMEDEEQVETAKNIVTAIVFEDIVDNFEDE